MSRVTRFNRRSIIGTRLATSSIEIGFRAINCNLRSRVGGWGEGWREGMRERNKREITKQTGESTPGNPVSKSFCPRALVFHPFVSRFSRCSLIDVRESVLSVTWTKREKRKLGEEESSSSEEENTLVYFPFLYKFNFLSSL